MIVIGIDPGRKRCGFCVEDSIQGTLRRGVISSLSLMDHIYKYKDMYPDAVVVCGNSESSRDLINTYNTQGVPIEFEDETGSTLEARVLYWRKHKKPWWGFFLPSTMLHAKRRLDDYAAVVIARRYINKHV